MKSTWPVVVTVCATAFAGAVGVAPSGAPASAATGTAHAAAKSGPIRMTVPRAVTVYNHARANIRPSLHASHAKIAASHLSVKPVNGRARGGNAFRLQPGHYLVSAHVRYRSIIKTTATRTEKVLVPGGMHAANCVVTAVDTATNTYTAYCANASYPNQYIEYDGTGVNGLAIDDTIQETVTFAAYWATHQYTVHETKLSAPQAVTLNRPISVRWGGYLRQTKPERGREKFRLNTSGPWTLHWTTNCRRFGFFSMIVNSPTHVDLIGHAHTGLRRDAKRIPWDGRIAIDVFSTGCTWQLTTISQHPFKLPTKSAPSQPSPPSQPHHSCTRTSTGSCIQGGEFCPQADYGQVGYDASGDAYTCTGDRTHPHWE